MKAQTTTQLNHFTFKIIEISINFHRILELSYAAFPISRCSVETTAVEVTVMLSNGPLLSLYIYIISYHDIS